MGRHGMLPVTPFSAAQTLADWTITHGRPPMSTDCRGSGGLMWYTTYYKCFNTSSFSAVLSLAFSLCSPASGPSLGYPARRMKPCLNAPDCSAVIVDEGRHIRFCSQCRGRQSQRYSVDEYCLLPALASRTLVRLRLDREGWASELADLSEL